MSDEQTEEDAEPRSRPGCTTGRVLSFGTKEVQLGAQEEDLSKPGLKRRRLSQQARQGTLRDSSRIRVRS